MAIWAALMLPLGAILMVAPNLLLTILGITHTDEVWIRVVGFLAALLGFYSLMAARSDDRDFMAATIPGRSGASVFFIVIVVTGLAPPVMLLFAAMDAAGVAMTWVGLRNDDAQAGARA